MVRMDGTAFHDSRTVYAVGKTLRIDDATTDGRPCGRGLHLAMEKHGPMKYNAVWPWRLFECSYSENDIVGQDDDKVRVSELRVERELDSKDIGLLRAEQFFARLDRLNKLLLRRFADEGINYLLPIENKLKLEGVEVDVFVVLLLEYESVKKILNTIGL